MRVTGAQDVAARSSHEAANDPDIVACSAPVERTAGRDVPRSVRDKLLLGAQGVRKQH